MRRERRRRKQGRGKMEVRERRTEDQDILMKEDYLVYGTVLQ